MGAIRVEVNGRSREVTLPSQALIGRGADVFLRLDDETVPTVWVELRWAERRGWAARVLGDPRRTCVSGGGPERDGWVALPAGATLAGPSARIELVDAGPPVPFLVDVVAGEVVTGPALDELVEWLGDDAHVPEDGRLLRDGDAFLAYGRAWRFRAGAPVRATGHDPVDLAHRGVALALRRRDGQFELEFVDGEERAVIRDRTVVAALPYAIARMENEPQGGWLDLDEAALLLCRAEDDGATAERVGVYRSRLLGLLRQRGIGSPERLFERDTRAGRPVRRLGFPPARVTLDL